MAKNEKKTTGLTKKVVEKEPEVTMQPPVEAPEEAPVEETAEVATVQETTEEPEPVKEAEIIPIQAETVPTGASQPQVRVRPKVDHKSYIGDRWYFFKKGQVQIVPQNVKDILVKANLLDPL